MRVEASKNRLISVRPRRTSRFLLIWRLFSAALSARSSSALISPRRQLLTGQQVTAGERRVGDEPVIKAGAIRPLIGTRKVAPGSVVTTQRRSHRGVANALLRSQIHRIGADSMRGARMSTLFTTHEVLNQSPPFEDVNLFTSDRPLMEAVKREGGGQAAKRLTAFGAVCGSAEAFERGRLANEYPPRLKAVRRQGPPARHGRVPPRLSRVHGAQRRRGPALLGLGPSGRTRRRAHARRQRRALRRLLHGDPDGGRSPVPRSP